MKQDIKFIGAGLFVVLFIVAGMVIIGSDANPGQSSDNKLTVNESDVPSTVLDSKDGAVALKTQFSEQYEYDSTVSITQTGIVVLQYNSTMPSGEQLKSEMQEIARLYADVAANHTNVGALSIQTNGVTLDVPSALAISHGQGDINEEAYFESVGYGEVGE